MADIDKQTWKALRLTCRMLHKVCDEAQRDIQRQTMVVVTVWNHHPYGHGEWPIKAYRSLDEIPETFNLNDSFWESSHPLKTKQHYHIFMVSLLEYFQFLRR